MATDTISVIIPVYNTKPYLRQCVQSVLDQTYQSLEIMLVDDGSSDGSSELCDEFAVADSRVTVYHLKHGGVSAARNYAIERCHGNWVSFVDSDDWLDVKMYEIMVDAFVQFHVDTVCCDAYDVGLGDCKVRCGWNTSEIINGKREVLNFIVGRSGVLWNKLLLASYVKAHRFREDIRYEEDVLFLTEYLLDTNSAYIINSPVYYYRKNRDGNVVSAKMDDRCGECIQAVSLIYDLMKANGATVGGFCRVAIITDEILSKIQSIEDIKGNEKYLAALSCLLRQVLKDRNALSCVRNTGLSRKRLLKLRLFRINKFLILYLRIKKRTERRRSS